MNLRAITAIGALFMATSAYAQVASLPTAPTPPTIETTSPNEVEANSMATTNKVYIDQGGDNVDVNITQTGSGNVIGLPGDKIYLRGDNQSFIGIQTGDNNSILMSLVSDLGAQGLATATLRQIGNGNQATIRCGNGENEASCNLFDMNARFTGDNNILVFHGTGSNIRNSMDVNGNNNLFNIETSSPNSSQTLLYTGDFNITNITQTGLGGTYGHSIYANVIGTGNSITSQQYGASETVINLTIMGNNGAYNIRTGH